MYDLVIIGGGPAGLVAALYAGRYNLKTLLISEKPGGEMALAPGIENYPGYEKITGIDLEAKIHAQIEKIGVKIKSGRVEDIKKLKADFVIKTQSGSLKARAILLATGTIRRKLGVAGEKEFFGRGVAYCATCDGPLFKGKTVAIIGGGDAGLASAFYMSKICPKIYVVEMLPKLIAEPYWQDKIKTQKNVEIILAAKTKEIKGDKQVKEIIIETSKGSQNLPVEGVFVEIGSVPNSELAKKIGVKLEKKGFVKIDKSGKTSIKGVWAAGDISTGSDYFWQILPSMAEGAIAAHSIFKSMKK